MANISVCEHCETVCELRRIYVGISQTLGYLPLFFFFSSRRRHTRLQGDWSSDVCSSDLIDNLIERGLDPKVCRLFIIDGAKALSKVIRRTFGAPTPIQRCLIHKARNVIERDRKSVV